MSQSLPADGKIWGAIKQRQTIWVLYGQPWGVERTSGRWGWGGFVVLLQSPSFFFFSALFLLRSKKQMCSKYSSLFHPETDSWDFSWHCKQGFMNVWNVSKSAENTPLLPVAKSINAALKWNCCRILTWKTEHKIFIQVMTTLLLGDKNGQKWTLPWSLFKNGKLCFLHFNLLLRRDKVAKNY